MDKKRQNDELRKLLKEVIKRTPKEDRKQLEELVKGTIRQHCTKHIQLLILELSQDLGVNEFDTMLELIPDIAIDLLKGLIVNILANTPEDKIEKGGELIDALIKNVGVQMEITDYRKAWKSIQKEMLEMTIKGRAGVLEI